MSRFERRIVITGVGLIGPLGNSSQSLWDALIHGKSGVAHLSRVPTNFLSTKIGGEARGFTGDISEFGELEKGTKRSIKKGLKLMCREIQMGVAASQLAIADAQLDLPNLDPNRIGTMFGSDYIMTMPEEYLSGIRTCIGDDGKFDFSVWAEKGIPEVEPLWLLKYLPNMPASHVAIYNDLRGPSNSLTVREASSNLSVSEAFTTLNRGIADIMIAGSTGSKIHPLRTVHVALQEPLAVGDEDPASACRPFDVDRKGAIIGEGAGVVVLEELNHATQRGATILGEVVGYASGSACDAHGHADYETVVTHTLKNCLKSGDLTPDQLGHVHAHGLSTTDCDLGEAKAISNVMGDVKVPVVAAKSHMGNLGAGSGMVELIASLLAFQHDQLFPILNLDQLDPACPIHPVVEVSKPGDSFININVTPQGQASAIAVRRFQG